MGLLQVFIGLCTYLATAHFVVWDCLVWWVLSGLELLVLFCSAWPLAFTGAAGVAVVQCSARPSGTAGCAFSLCGRDCSAWSSSILVGLVVNGGSSWSVAFVQSTPVSVVAGGGDSDCRGSVQSAPPRQYVVLLCGLHPSGTRYNLSALLFSLVFCGICSWAVRWG